MPAREEENKALIRRLYEQVYANWNFSLLPDLIAPGFTGHGTPPEIPSGPDGVRQFYQQLRSAFPDIRYTIEDILAEGDKVAVRWTWCGTHLGDYYGIAPTGKPAKASGIAIYRIEAGKCVERWAGFNPLAVLRQLGARITADAPAE